LIREVEPVEGLNTLANNRYTKAPADLSKRELINLTNGPGKLCKAMAKGQPLCFGDGPFFPFLKNSVFCEFFSAK